MLRGMQQKRQKKKNKRRRNTQLTTEKLRGQLSLNKPISPHTCTNAPYLFVYVYMYSQRKTIFDRPRTSSVEINKPLQDGRVFIESDVFRRS